MAKAVSSWRWHVSCGLRRSGDKQARLGDGQVPRPPVKRVADPGLLSSSLSILAKEPPESPCPRGLVALMPRPLFESHPAKWSDPDKGLLCP